MKRITIQVDLVAEVPDNTSDETIEAITLEIPVEAVRIDGDNGEIVGAHVLSYTTTDVSIG